VATRTIDLTTAFTAETCITCGIVFGLPEDFHQALRGNGKGFYCPNGHSMWYGKGEVDKLREQLARAQAQATHYRDQADAEERARRHAERSAAAMKGVNTRLRNQIRQGLCPAGCGQAFADIEAHMAAHHPDFTDEPADP
jgi:Zn-finger nucleic acid-binding protein